MLDCPQRMRCIPLAIEWVTRLAVLRLVAHVGLTCVPNAAGASGVFPVITTLSVRPSYVHDSSTPLHCPLMLNHVQAYCGHCPEVASGEFASHDSIVAWYCRSPFTAARAMACL